MSQLARLLAGFVFGREGLSRRLEASPFVQGVAHWLRLRQWVNTALARYPIRRHLAGSGVQYQIENFETLAVERAYFQDPAYREIFAAEPPATFIDLGCNSGIFPCLLSHLANGRAPRGLCIDANQQQADLAQKTVQLNDWPDVHVRCGLVGEAGDHDGKSEFFLHPTSLGSSRFAYRESTSGRATEWKPTRVPTLNVASTWNDLFGPALRCDCLKIDIEGSEMNFLRSESEFLSCAGSILLEWHVWTTTRHEVVEFLHGKGFRLQRTMEDSPRLGVLYFQRS